MKTLIITILTLISISAFANTHLKSYELCDSPEDFSLIIKNGLSGNGQGSTALKSYEHYTGYTFTDGSYATARGTVYQTTYGGELIKFVGNAKCFHEKGQLNAAEIGLTSIVVANSSSKQTAANCSLKAPIQPGVQKIVTLTTDGKSFFCK